MTQVSHQYNNQSNSRRTKDSFPSRTIKTVKAGLENVIGRKTKYSSITGSVEVDISWFPLSSTTPGPPPPFPSTIRGVVSVFIYSANNLVFYTANNGGAAVPTSPGYLPSPQASLKVGNNME